MLAVGLPAVLLTVAACRQEAGAVREGERRIVTPGYRLLWSRTFDVQDTLLAFPSQVVLTGGTVAVLDQAMSRVVGLSVRDGSAQWTYDKVGSGSGELGGPSTVTVGQDGATLVVDPRNAKVVRLSAAGRYLDQFTLPAPNIRSACLQREGQLVGCHLHLGTPLVAMSLATGQATTLRNPWPVALPDPQAGSAAFGEFVRLSQAVLAPAGRGRCIVARLTAPGVAMFEGDSLVWTNNALSGPAVEVLREDASAATSVAAVGTGVAVAYGGLGSRRDRLIDGYDVETGRYRHSWQAPEAMSWMTMTDSLMVVLHIGNDNSRISAWRVSRGIRE